ncbi:MAG: hypothetical protein KDD99_31700, partial [Bacteroidetes bacterium]|nr:hypothetical protein [Bacteroidota bacterium]
TPGLKKKTGNSSIESLPVFTIQCSLSDVVLSHFHNEDIKERVKLLVAGDNLEFSLGAQFYRAALPGQWNEMAACFSTSLKSTLDQHFAKGYKVKSLRVGHIVYWWDKEMEAGVRVVLPEVELGK